MRGHPARRVDVVVATAVAIASFAVSVGSAQDPAAARAQSPSVESIEARVDRLFAQWNRADPPGCSVAVGWNDAIVYERGYGMANLELGVPIGPASVFEAASISKAFTAMSILLLAQQGRLSIDPASLLNRFCPATSVWFCDRDSNRRSSFG